MYNKLVDLNKLGFHTARSNIKTYNQSLIQKYLRIINECGNTEFTIEDFNFCDVIFGT